MKFFDALENRDPGQRERDLFAALPKQLAYAKANAPAFAELYGAIDVAAVNSRAALAKLPVIRKHELIERQKALPPFGGLNATPVGKLGRVFSSPGPIYDPEGTGEDWWRFARSLHAAGFRAGDLVHNTFSYHFTPAGFMTEGAARKIGCAVFPAGVGQTEMQVQAIADLKPTGYIGTPSFLKIIIEKADELKADVSSLKKAVVSGEAFFPNQKALCAERGIHALQAYGTADLGLVAYETEAREGLVLEESLILEIVRPGTGDPVAPGEVGEVVITSFNPGLSADPLRHRRPVGRAAGHQSLRAHQRAHQGLDGPRRPDRQGEGHVRASRARWRRSSSAIRRSSKARLVVDNETGQDRMTLRCEVAATPDGAGRCARRQHPRYHQAARRSRFAAAGELPNDGKVIDDARKYD